MFEHVDEKSALAEIPQRRAEDEVLSDPMQFLSLTEMPTDYVRLPVAKKKMRIKGLRSRERAELEKRMEEKRGKDRTVNLKLFREWLIIYCAIKPDGSQLFGTEHLVAMQNMASGDITTAADAILKLSGIGEQEVDEMVGNSGDSPSDS